MQVVLIYLFHLAYQNGFDPCKDLVFEVETTSGVKMQVGRITLALVGGILCGVGCALPLRGGSSTGGMDIVSQAYSFKTNIPFTLIASIIDGIIIIAGAILGGSIAVGVYTIIRLIVHIITLDKIHTIYKFQKVTIITENPDEISKALLVKHPHGITIYKAVGAYSKAEKFVLESVIFTYELEDYRNIIKSIDSKSFVYYTAIRGIMGNYNRRAIN